MPVAEIPSIYSSLEHSAIVFLRVSHQPRVLLGREKFVLRRVAVSMHVLIRALLQINKLVDDFFLAGLRQIESGGIAVGLFVFAEVIEAGITEPSAPCSRGIY